MKPMRLAMPETADWIDRLRDVFGRVDVDEQIRQGMSGAPAFFARENNEEVGTRFGDGGFARDASDVARSQYCNGCNGACAGTLIRCSSFRKHK